MLIFVSKRGVIDIETDFWLMHFSGRVHQSNRIKLLSLLYLKHLLNGKVSFWLKRCRSIICLSTLTETFFLNALKQNYKQKNNLLMKIIYFRKRSKDYLWYLPNFCYRLDEFKLVYLLPVALLLLVCVFGLITQQISSIQYKNAECNRHRHYILR